MEERIARIEIDIASIQLDVREFRTDMKAAKEPSVDARSLCRTSRILRG
jgi:hypothetical protein